MKFPILPLKIFNARSGVILGGCPPGIGAAASGMLPVTDQPKIAAEIFFIIVEQHVAYH